MIILEKVWYLEKGNVIPAFRKGKEKNRVWSSFNLTPVRVRNQTTEEITSRRRKEKKVVSVDSERKIMLHQSDRLLQGRGVDVVYLYCSKLCSLL